jgi:thiol-disulfide isomerase/thioredoxin
MTPVRRRMALGAVALAAAGAGVAWRLSREAGAAGAPPELWRLRLPMPGGGTLALQSLRDKPLLLNFWATWCPPCVRELPLFDSAAQAHAGWHVAGLAIDSLDAVQRFLQHTPVRFPIGLAGPEAYGLMRALGNGMGGLPFTVVLDATGRVQATRLGETHAEELQSWLAAR